MPNQQRLLRLPAVVRLTDGLTVVVAPVCFVEVAGVGTATDHAGGDGLIKGHQVRRWGLSLRRIGFSASVTDLPEGVHALGAERGAGI